jgi:uncharacterized membrane protein YgcG
MRLSLIIKKATPPFLFILAFLLTPLASLAEQPFPKPRGLINDFANVIPQSYEQKLVTITSELLNKTGTPVVVLILAVRITMSMQTVYMKRGE